MTSSSNTTRLPSDDEDGGLPGHYAGHRAAAALVEGWPPPAPETLAALAALIDMTPADVAA